MLSKIYHWSPSAYISQLGISTLAIRTSCFLDMICMLIPYSLKKFAPPEDLMQTKSQKQLVLTGAARFNAKPKTGLAFLEENKLIYSDLSPEISKPRSLATFLKNCTRLDKRLLGDFISKPNHIELLKEFIGLFDFKNVGICLLFEVQDLIYS